MQPPPHAEIFESELGTYWFDEEGILNCLSKPPKRTVENVTANIALIKKISHDTPVRLMIHLCNSPIPDKATRDHVTKSLSTIYKAMAMVSDKGIGKIIMNVLFRLKPPSIPMKTFRDEASAREWLRQF